MKLEFLRDSSPEGPLIRLYGFDAAEARQLRGSALRLAKKRTQTIELHRQPAVTPLGGCELTLRLANKTGGVTELAACKFDWLCSQSGWLEVAGLIKPFCRPGTPGENRYQWLTRSGRIAVLLSMDGKW